MAIQLPNSSVSCFSFSLGLSVRHRENEKPSWNVLRGECSVQLDTSRVKACFLHRGHNRVVADKLSLRKGPV